MITIINRPQAPYVPSLEVLLDLSLNDVDTPSDELKALLKECKTTKRKVGCVLQQYAPSVYFSYDPANQAHTEAGLLAALCMPKPEIHVSQASGGESWAKY